MNKQTQFHEVNPPLPDLCMHVLKSLIIIHSLEHRNDLRDTPQSKTQTQCRAFSLFKNIHQLTPVCRRRQSVCIATCVLLYSFFKPYWHIYLQPSGGLCKSISHVSALFSRGGRKAKGGNITQLLCILGLGERNLVYLKIYFLNAGF